MFIGSETQRTKYVYRGSSVVEFQSSTTNHLRFKVQSSNPSDAVLCHEYHAYFIQIRHSFKFYIFVSLLLNNSPDDTKVKVGNDHEMAQSERNSA